MNKSQIETEFRNLQNLICGELELLDGKSIFREDAWTRDEGGGGFTRTITDGNIIEKCLGCKAIQRWCDVGCGAADKRLIDEYPAANAGLPKYQRLK